MKRLTFEDVLAAEDHPKARELLGRKGTGHIARSDWRFRRRDGAFFIGETAGRRLPDGRIQIVIRDITERKEAEEVQRRLHALAMLRLASADIKTMLEAILDAAIAIALGVDAVISKPITSDAVQMLVAECARRSSSRQP